MPVVVGIVQNRSSEMSSKSPFLFPDIDFDNATLALRPLVIPGMVDPIQDGDGGINLKVVEDSDAGMLCVIPAYIGMHVGDKHVIYWDKQSVFTKEVEADEVDFPLFFYLPVAIARPGWAEECYYQLTRFGGTAPDDPAVSQRLLVKLTRPGGRDDHPNDPDGHGKLFPVTLPPEVVQQGIDAEWAKKGVPVTVPFYPDMAVRDTVLVKWGSTVLAPHTVTQDEVDHKTPIVIIADQAAILAGGDNDALVLRYDIHDEVWNWTVRHSQSARVRVEAGAWRLGMPIIKEAINGVITIKDLNKLDITVQVKLESADFELGDTVTLSWIGTPLNGKPLVHTESKPVVSIPSILEFKVPYAQIRAIAMGLGDASYVLTKKNGAPPLSSKRAFAEVIGDVSMLPEPIIRELFGDTLEPDEAQATVDVRYPDIANGDLINLIWAGTRAGGQSYRHEAQHTVSDNEARQGMVTLYVTNEHIRVLDQGRLDLSYRVSNDKVALYGVIESERLLVNVANLHATLPVPKVEEADPPDVLDPSGVLDSVHVLIDQARTLRKDILTYYWRAPDPLGSTSDWLPITTVTEGKPVRFRVDAQFVTGNIGGYVKVRYALWRAATQKYEYSATLDLLIGEVVSPTITSVTDSKGEEIPDKGVTVETRVTLTGTASKGLKVRVLDNDTPLGEPTADLTTGVWTLPVTGLSVAVHRFKAKALYGSGVESAIRELQVVAQVTPSIDNVTDSKGPVVQGGITFDRNVTVTGKASPNQKVRLRDGTNILHEPTANGSGVWTQVVSALTVRAYSLTALALYGDGPESTPPRTFTVAQAVTPTIT
ncbi:Ig-like domain-containing protein, partial [Pseudomonas sp. MPR-ANC1]|uniref:Ig-like domain-containing protein n=1 Tax=Pseudomonas sp. MPR-ANC1 TaxID=2075548 RepID=UPI0011AF5B2B